MIQHYISQPTINQLEERSQEQHLQEMENKLRYYRLLKQPLHNLEKYLTDIKNPMLMQV